MPSPASDYLNKTAKLSRICRCIFDRRGASAGAEARLAMQKGQAVQRGAARALAPWQAQRAIQLLLSATSAGCSVEMLANACGLSPSHFAHAFKASTGVPPHRWLLLHRVQKARELMESTRDSLSAIALSCGFSDQSHLTRAFRSVMGSSPGAWRRERRMGVTAAEMQSREAAGGAFDRSRQAALASSLSAGRMGEEQCHTSRYVFEHQVEVGRRG
jgi:AraC-like DNA-binding protein